MRVRILHSTVVLQQSRTVGEVLDDLGATSAPIIVALNKIDRLPDPDAAAPLLSEFPNSLAISALTGGGLAELLARVDEVLEAALVPLTVRIPYREAGLLTLFHQRGNVEREEHGAEGTLVQGRIPAALLGRFQPFLLPRQGIGEEDDTAFHPDLP